MNLKNSVPSRLVLIGASTGGPGQIQNIIAALPEMEDTSIIIAQHMAEAFIPSFTKRLQEHSDHSISSTDAGQTLMNGHIYIANKYTELSSDDWGLRFVQNSSPLHTYDPDIDLLLNSITPLAKDLDLMYVILTGIGEDSVQGCRELSEQGARCITKSEESAVVDGMPSRAKECVPHIEVMHKDAITQAIKEYGR